MSGKASTSLPPLLCGPIIRRLTPEQLTLWWVSPTPSSGSLALFFPGEAGERPCQQYELNERNVQVIPVGQRAFVHLLEVSPESPLPTEQKIEYDLQLATEDGIRGLSQMAPGLCYPGQQRPSLMVKTQINRLLHGSCRNPHHDSPDTLVTAAAEVGEVLDDSQQRPAMLMMSGDQIYADHVAGPTLQAIHQVIALLGLNDEGFSEAAIEDCQALYHSELGLYQREKLLPRTKVGKSWYRRGGLHPVFTSTSSHNHLVSFAEVMAMYFLVWSPALWDRLDMTAPSLAAPFDDLYRQELACIEAFVEGLPDVRRLMAHVPTYMIFDDHDITDDWNLTARWEQAAYGHPFSRRIIGNTLMGYWLCQAWGNAPEHFRGDFMQQAMAYFSAPDDERQDAFINLLLKFERWHYELPTSPKVVVLDSRTRRWRSEIDLSKPSGLMDWEALTEMQQLLIGEEAVILVSPAPMFGVKLIETIQHLVTMAGYPLAVDAENWMAHGGSAYTLLQIFKHVKTPKHFVILSGDVHYSFAYDVVIRFSDNSPHIWQITSSGVKNEFPNGILRSLDRLNRWLFAPYSPLNWLTKRRNMKIRQRIPLGFGGERLVNRSGIGMVCLDNDGAPTRIEELHGDGSVTRFVTKAQVEELVVSPSEN